MLVVVGRSLVAVVGLVASLIFAGWVSILSLEVTVNCVDKHFVVVLLDSVGLAVDPRV